MQTPNTHALTSAIRSMPYRLAVLGFSAVAIGALAMNYTDSRSTVGYTEVCFQPAPKIAAYMGKKGKRYCTASQRYWIADPILADSSRHQPEFYSKLTRLQYRPSETQNKWIYGVVALGSSLCIAGLGAARLNLINKLAPGYRKEVQAQWHRDAVKNGVQMAADAIDGRYAVMNKLVQSETNYGRYQAAILTPSEIIATQQAYLDAEAQARLQGEVDSQSVEPQQQQLPGQSLDDITTPKDKVSGADTTPPKLPTLISTLDQSALAPILKAGVLKVIGGQGSGKTTLVNGGLLRYRMHQGHKLIIINPHKSFEMYKGLEPYLESGTEFYAVGRNDDERSKSLLTGMHKVLGILETRYTEYQNQPFNSYNHYPITILIEECGEWAGLLGEKALQNIQHFWQKMFIACRKAKLFPIITAQDDTMAMFGNPKGLAELIKSSGAVTLNLIAVPDSNSPDGWRPSGKGVLYLPNAQPQELLVPNIRNLVTNPDIFTDQNFEQNTTQQRNSREELEDLWKRSPEYVNAEFVEMAKPTLSENAQKILKWLQANRVDGRWVKYKGKEGRDGGFRNFLSDNGVDAVARDKALAELVEGGYVEIQFDSIRFQS